MKKITLILFTFHVSLLTIYSQSVTQEWVKRYDGPEHLNDMGECIQPDKFGNLFVAGNTESSSGSGNILVIKYNSSGTELWNAVYNSPGNDTDFTGGMCVDDSGNVYVTGSSTGTGPGTGYVTIKYNFNGILQWVSTYKGHSDIGGIANAIALDSSGNIYVTGSIETIPNGSDIVTIKYNPQTGDSIWTRRFHETGSAGNYDENAFSICADITGNIYVAGSSYGNSGPPYSDYLLIKYNTEGELVWFKKYNGAGNNRDFIKHMCLDKHNNVYVTGLSYVNVTGNIITTIKYDSVGVMKWLNSYTGTMNSIKQVGGIAADNASNVYVSGYVSVSHATDYVTVKYDTAGVQQWAVLYNGTGNSYDECYGMKIDDSANIYITGISVNTNNGYDFATVKYNSNGIQQWVARYPGSPPIDGSPITIDKIGNVYVTGNNEEGGTGTDVITIKYSQPIGIISINGNVPYKYILYQNYPNPFNPTTNINIELPFAVYVKLTIYDVLGKEIAVLVNKKLSAGKYNVDWDGSNYPSGVYFYRLKADDFFQTRKMVLIK